MSSDDNFIARWSRLKRSAAHGKKAKPKVRAPGSLQVRDVSARQTAAAQGQGSPQAKDAPFDPATLPPIESIVADSDIRAFLRSEVPAHLTRAALQRAWAADPAIRDFIGIAENQWDFTDPTTIPGFGPLGGTDDLRQFVSQAMGELPDVADAVAPSRSSDGRSEDHGLVSTPVTREAPATRPRPDPDVDAGNHRVAASPAAPQHPQPADANDGIAARRRGHGSALPR